MLNNLSDFLATPSLIGPKQVGASPKQVMPWRGVLIDSARSFYPASELLGIIDLLGRYGFNRLHWHLSDDQGWRLPIPEYPLLAQVSAQLKRGDFSHYDCLSPTTLSAAEHLAADGGWRNGCYTESQIRHLVSYAQDRGITIVPEIDLPGHMAAAIKAYPHLGRPADAPIPTGSVREQMYWPAQNDLLWPSDQSVAFIKAVLRQVTKLFPGPYVHIGGDECAYPQWLADPILRSWMADHQLQDGPALQAWFTQIALKELYAASKQPLVWDEACQLVDAGALVVAWNGAKGMRRIHDCPQRYIYARDSELYLNRIDPRGQADQLGMVPGISVVDLLSHHWPEASDSRCLGVQACFWGEFILNTDLLLQMMFPRLLAVASRCWAPNLPIKQALSLIEQEYAQLKQVLT